MSLEGGKSPHRGLQHTAYSLQSSREGRSGSGARDEEPGLGRGSLGVAVGMLGQWGALLDMVYHPHQKPPATFSGPAPASCLPQGAWEWDLASFTLQLMDLPHTPLDFPSGEQGSTLCSAVWLLGLALD